MSVYFSQDGVTGLMVAASEGRLPFLSILIDKVG